MIRATMRDMCDERENLWAEYTSALARYYAVKSRQDPDGVIDAMSQKDAAAAARMAWLRHCTEHGCSANGNQN
jgi:hypothetical protein